jgi:DUF2905 family protein
MGIGVVLVVAGALTMLGERVGIKLGRLPGDIVMRGKHGSFYFPIVTCLILSIVLSLISWILNRR